MAWDGLVESALSIDSVDKQYSKRWRQSKENTNEVRQCEKVGKNSPEFALSGRVIIGYQGIKQILDSWVQNACHS